MWIVFIGIQNKNINKQIIIIIKIFKICFTIIGIKAGIIFFADQDYLNKNNLTRNLS